MLSYSVFTIRLICLSFAYLQDKMKYKASLIWLEWFLLKEYQRFNN